MAMLLLLLLVSRFSRVRWGVAISDRGQGRPYSRADGWFQTWRKQGTNLSRERWPFLLRTSCRPNILKIPWRNDFLQQKMGPWNAEVLSTVNLEMQWKCFSVPWPFSPPTHIGWLSLLHAPTVPQALLSLFVITHWLGTPPGPGIQ